MKVGADLQAFMDRLGHDFTRPELLIRALTHGSVASPTRPDNQRLEFLGDRVLGLTIAEALFRADKTASEGQLAPRYNAFLLANHGPVVTGSSLREATNNTEELEETARLIFTLGNREIRYLTADEVKELR